MTLPASVDVVQTGSSITIMVDALDLTLTGTVADDGSFMVTSPPTESELDATCSATSTGSAEGNFESETVSVSISLSEPTGTCTDFSIPCAAMLSGTFSMADELPPVPDL